MQYDVELMRLQMVLTAHRSATRDPLTNLHPSYLPRHRCLFEDGQIMLLHGS